MNHVIKELNAGRFGLARQKLRAEVLASIRNGISRNHFTCPGTGELLLSSAQSLLNLLPERPTEDSHEQDQVDLVMPSSSGSINPLTGEQVVVRVPVSTPGHIKVTVFNLQHEPVSVLFDSSASAGILKIPWDGKNSFGQVVASGTFLILVEGPDFKEIKRVIVRK